MDWFLQLPFGVQSPGSPSTGSSSVVGPPGPNRTLVFLEGGSAKNDRRQALFFRSLGGSGVGLLVASLLVCVVRCVFASGSANENSLLKPNGNREEGPSSICIVGLAADSGGGLVFLYK